jgi:hypothetical protein
MSALRWRTALRAHDEICWGKLKTLVPTEWNEETIRKTAEDLHRDIVHFYSVENLTTMLAKLYDVEKAHKEWSEDYHRLLSGGTQG